MLIQKQSEKIMMLCICSFYMYPPPVPQAISVDFFDQDKRLNTHCVCFFGISNTCIQIRDFKSNQFVNQNI